ncbi:sushi, von Willebrand factor type A, EGF and pentraxin domain-containing protein 1-like [Watersipora subatra]|uniref:sushi, von Willebrand factor type A, EGF and pentraxin domain-containing protein 1-like n=1 Tax=Watersipora subatra TaxID=2589382 RepID=UPI00355BB318
MVTNKYFHFSAATVLQNCTLDSDDCDENAQCVNSSGSQICMCNEGYEGVGRTCQEVSCGTPPTVDNSDTLSTYQTGEEYLDTVIYQCLEGYVINSTTSSVTCQANRTWTTPPTCTEVLCGEPPVVFYANHQATVQTGSKYQDRVIYTCQPGYEVSSGYYASYCEASGKWYPTPRCSSLVTCIVGQSECGVNAECTNSSGSYTCRCNEGYEGDGLTCLGKDCGSPILSGVTCSGNQTRYPNTVSCDCLLGYERANSRFSLTCGDTGVWSMPSDNITAGCTRVDCGTSPVVAYSDAQATYRTGTEYQDRVTFSCLSGYEISTEPNYVVCLSNRTWTPPPVCTKVNCGPPPDVRNIDNLTTVQNETRFGDQVTYACLPGYEMFTEFSSVVCLADGRWSGTPRCTAKDCGPVPPATGINCTSSSTRYPSNATCSCNTGYERFNQQYTVNCQTSGTWSSPQDGHPPRCEKVECGIPPVVDNSESQALIQTGTKYEDRVTYMCLQGYEDEHNLTSITCQATGQWSTAPTCLRVSCGTPPTIQHMNTQATVQSGTKYEDTVEYYCLPGYLVQSGTRSIRCQSTKQWTEPPSCTKIDCGTPPDVENGAPNRRQYNTTFDSEITYKCDGHQYNMIGSATVRCTEDGTWSTPPICHEVNCGAPPTVDNSDRQVSGHSYIDTVRYECYVGYTLEGNSTIVCQVIGHWTVPPSCVELPCGDPPEIENTKVFPIVTGTTVGAEARYSCKTGYVMSGEPVIKCQVNQQWSTSPQCNRIRCGEPPDVQNALKSVGGHYLNDSTEYECHIGYVRIGNELIFCQADGHWTVAPTCDDSSTLSPDSSTLSPDSSTLSPDSSTLSPDSSTLFPDSSTLFPDSSALFPDSSALFPDNSTLSPDSSTFSQDSSTRSLQIAVLSISR